jgi:hypothetical protein
MSRKLQTILEALDSCLCEHIDQLETVTPNLEEDTDAFIADDIRELMEDIRGVINEEQ